MNEKSIPVEDWTADMVERFRRNLLSEPMDISDTALARILEDELAKPAGEMDMAVVSDILDILV